MTTADYLLWCIALAAAIAVALLYIELRTRGVVGMLEHGNEEYCSRCDNRGYIIDCIDDMCANGDECIHGDGNRVCPDCHGRNL